MIKPTRTAKVKKPEDTSSFIRWRYLLVGGVMGLALVGLLLRASWIQVINPDRLIREGDMRSLRVQSVATPRGMITDRAGRPLAVSVPVDAVWADPKEIAEKASLDKTERWSALADALGIPLDKLTSRVKTNPTSRFTYLARQISPSLASYVRDLKIPGIYLKQESRRFYPSGEVSAHILGFTNIDGKGIEGVEKSFDTWLTGEPGKRIVRKDRFGRVVENISSVESRAAHDLSLSIDERLQAMAYRELKNAVAFNKAESGSIVLLDVQTGEVLAMANLPSYNPNNRGQIDSAHYRNRAITDTFEPGSTVKPLV
ncbi:MAG: penicillin-binding transpeptidase domain-containing protein, partial [Plesiomonas sp.]|uniref:penicillin-binding transpeptidase domain-containing protein n=1 Tax=Plesiomonas sp. TaxID=2486279 RepID=UPI003EE804CB